MTDKKKRQMDITGKVNLLDLESFISAIREIYERHYGKNEGFSQIEKTTDFVYRLFNGEIDGYHACDTAYHDITHTAGTALAMARIFDGMDNYSDIETIPKFKRSGFVLGINSSMLCDTGLITLEGDDKGTGAKYTSKRADRSKEVITQNLFDLGFDDVGLVGSIRNIIGFTGVELTTENINSMPFKDLEEKTIGLVLYTADILSQMADRNYLKKLPILYNELKEGDVSDFESAEDLILKTPDYWRNTVLPRLKKECGAVYKFLEYHFEGGRNLYMEGVERNIKRIEQQAKRTV